MNNFFLYRFVYEKENGNLDKFPCSATVIFCPGDEINKTNLQTEIKLFYEKHHHTDEIIVIGAENIKTELKDAFEKETETVFKYLYKVDKKYIDDNLYILTFDKNGKLKSNNSKKLQHGIEKQFLNYGLQNIFISRGGFVESKGAHHFVFPSGKHCNKFLRTGNILLHSSEIYFIAFTLLRFYKEEKHNQIYCDTSSINTIAFALLDLKRKLLPNNTFKPIPIESFSSYEGLQDNQDGYFANSLILISASTSGNILDKIKKSNRLAKKENMIILYFLGSDDAYSTNEDNILCNLTKNNSNEHGIDYYKTFDVTNCDHCASGSYPVNVIGDVFLLEKPKINWITFNVNDSPKEITKLVNEFYEKDNSRKSIFKVSYKENEREVNKKYEIYFDVHEVINSLDKYKNFEKKLNHYIDQYVPSNTKYLIHLNDEGSKLLAELILKKIKANYLNDKLPKILSQDELNLIDKEEIGAVIIVSSCISNGKNLLYISRFLRINDKLRIIYFIALTRTKNETQLNFLKSNLMQGIYGKETNIFISIYNFYMVNDSIDTTWVLEIEFLKKVKYFLDETTTTASIIQFLNNRISFIEEHISDIYKGLSNSLFYPNIIKGEELSLRKSFAFSNTFPLNQAEVYFFISSIINNLRNSKDLAKCLIQTEYVRNIIEPGNFNRFNDGIIQASILRAASKQELSYSLDYELSKNMFDILFTMIKNYNSDQGEALFEFVYALATKKMTLLDKHLLEVCKVLKDSIKNDIFIFFVDYLEKEVLKIVK